MIDQDARHGGVAEAMAREGRGAVVERLYREVRASAIPGGSEEILLDFAMRQVAGKL